MADDEGSGGIDFSVGQPGAAGTDEELVEPGGGRPDHDRPHSPRRGLVVGAAVLIGAALVTRGFGHDNSPNPSAHRSAVTSPSAAAPSAVARPVPLFPGNTAQARLAPGALRHAWRFCPDARDGLLACSSETQVPAPVLRALRDRFPAARPISAYEELLRDVGFGPGGLWYRELHARDGRHMIAVQVRRQPTGERVRIVKYVDARQSTVTITRPVRGFTVRVRISGPSGRALPTRAGLAFAADPRLTAPSG